MDAALAVLDDVGMDGLSMRKVADKLGTGAASLYWHVRNKDELFQLVFDRVVEDVVLPTPDPSRWQEQLRELANQVRTVLTRHRDVGRLTLGRVPGGTQVASLGEWFFSLLLPVGVPERVVAYLGDFFGLYVGAYAFEESLGPQSPTGEQMTQEQIASMMQSYAEALPEDQFPNVRRAAALLFDSDRDSRWEFGLDLILRGLDSYATKRPPAPRLRRKVT